MSTQGHTSSSLRLPASGLGLLFPVPHLLTVAGLERLDLPDPWNWQKLFSRTKPEKGQTPVFQAPRRYVPSARIARTKSGLSLAVIPAAGSYLCLTLPAYLIPGWKCIFSHGPDRRSGLAAVPGCLVALLLGWDLIPSCPRVSGLGGSLVVMASSRRQSRVGCRGGLDTPKRDG